LPRDRHNDNQRIFARRFNGREIEPVGSLSGLDDLLAL
jgi:hypothetical protein